MTVSSRFFIAMKVTIGLLGSINLGISTAFLLTKHIDFFQLGIVYSIILGTSLVLEYPTGVLADRFGRKRTFAFGLLTTALQYGGYAAFWGAPLLYVAALCGGVGDALISGSLEAWLISEEKKLTPEPKLYHVFGLSRSLGSVVSISVSLIVGLLLTSSLGVVYWTAAGMMAAAGLIALVLLPDNRGSGGNALNYSLDSLKTFMRAPAMIFLSLVLAAAFACYSVFILYWQPRLQEFGVPASRLTLVNVAYLVGTALASYAYAQWARKLSASVFLFTSFGAATLSFALMVFTHTLPLFIAALFLYGVGYGSVIPLFFSWAADIIPADLRASMLSLMNAVASGAAVLVTMVIGRVITQWGIPVAARIGLALGVGILVLLALIRPLARTWEIQPGSKAPGQAESAG